MRQDWLNTQAIKVLKQRNMSLVFGLGMLIANIVLGFALMFKTERVVFVPPEINKTFWVTNKSASTTYLEEMGQFLGLMLLNKTALSVKHDRGVILKYVSPKFYGVLHDRLLKQEKYMLSQDLTTRFTIHEIETDAATNKVTLTGELRSFIASKEVKVEVVSYEMTFEHRGFRYLLDDFKELGKENEN